MSVIIDGSAGVTTNVGAVYNGLQTGTAVASTSGTSIDFTSIPSWVKRITVLFSGVSLSGTSSILIQLGDSGGIENTGYVSYVGETPTISSTAGFVCYLGSATRTLSGIYIISNISSNSWSGSSSLSNSAAALAGAGSKTLSDTITQLRITTVNGTDTFDAGSINIIYE